MSPRHLQPLLPELMDDPELSLEETERALSDLEKVNRWLLGVGASRRTLLPLVCAQSGPSTLLDIGTGSGQLAADVTISAARRGAKVQVVGIDRKLSHLLSGKRRGHTQLRVVASAESLPFRGESIDWATSNLFLHHFTPAQNRRILDEMRRVVRQGVAIIDLRQSFWAKLLFRLLLPLLRLGPVASYDGRLSTDQAWSLPDVMKLAEGLENAELRARFPFRFSLVVAAGSR